MIYGGLVLDGPKRGEIHEEYGWVWFPIFSNLPLEEPATIGKGSEQETSITFIPNVHYYYWHQIAGMGFWSQSRHLDMATAFERLAGLHMEVLDKNRRLRKHINEQIQK